MADESKTCETFRRVRAAKFGGPEVLEVETAPVSELVPGEGQVLVKLAYAGVNPVDTYILTGTYVRKPALPYTPGIDGAGTILAVGAGVTDRKVGDRVYVAGAITGTYAERTLCAAANAHPLPETVSFAAGAAIGVPAYTAYRALFHRSKATPGEWVLVHGASGAVGQASVQLAVDAGLNVIGTAGSEAGLALVKAAGALFAFNHHDADIASKVKAATGGHGVDVLLEMLANVNLGKDLPMLAQHGRVAVIGSRGEVTVNPRDLMAREASVIGVALGGSTPQDKATAEAYITAKLGNGSLKPVVGAEFDLDTISEAHKSVIEHSGGSSGKVVVKCSAH